MSKPSFLRSNGLSVVFFGLTILSIGAHVLAGHAADSGERSTFGLLPLTVGQYVLSGAFLSSLFENWESEFVQMGLFVLLTVWLRQRGSSESKPVDEEPDQGPYRATSASPWPVRRGGAWLRLYEHSLSIALFSLFLLAFAGHWLGSYHHYLAEERMFRRVPSHDLWEHLGSSTFWFESFQNWQSEFFSIALLVVLSIYLREKNSPQSKAVDAAHSDTGQ